VNVLKPHLKSIVFTLISQGISQREIHRLTGIDRKTIRLYAKSVPTEAAAGDSNSSTLATGSM
jgi:DNA invertase Pin-like site-specific DNA recombinase